MAHPRSEICPFKTLLHELSKQLTADDIEDMKALLRDRQLARADEEKIKTPMDLFYHLEVNGDISGNNMDLLKKLFRIMKRPSLIEMLNEFREGKPKKTKSKRRKSSKEKTDTVDTQNMLQPSSDENPEVLWYEVPKIIQDPIHGTVALDPVYMEIIDTPEFQRLREIKQLGTVNFVYPGAVHTRFEHSIGTCHLALRMVRHFKSQESLGITREEELCVGLGALCHNLGK
ncbi:deoxynucleoside triphosphate triphosphohydrolase sahd-1-like [Ptychodera flava]|uniref:deoxynucleoside triphosphate triphosphohydrolase sahd-1-like n=1 Tax=Ptychodera flava TaxID=63121 RepID=UPI00396A74B4